MNKYPNLQELIKYHPYGETVVCEYARIEPELLHAALDGKEVLTPIEIIAIARLYGCSAGVLNHPKVIMLDMNKLKHNRMVTEIDFMRIRLKCMARHGNLEAKKYLEWADRENQVIMRMAYNNKVSYGCYLGVKECLDQYLCFATPKPKRRGLETS